MKTIKIKIQGLQVREDGTLVVLTAPHAINAKGAFVMNEAQTRRICQRAGVPSAFGLKHVESLSNGTSFLTIQAEDCKAGDTWKNEKTGETGVYEKDWTKYSNHEIELGFASKMKLAELSLSAAFANPQFSQPTPKVVIPEVVAEENGDEPNV